MDRNKMINIRGIAVIGVIIIHLTINYIQRENFGVTSFLGLSLNTFFRFSVPVFFISSGIGISKGYTKYTNYKDFYISRLKIIPDFIFWSVVYFFVNDNNFTLKNIIKLLVGKSYYHLYFIPALIICYLIYPIIDRYVNSRQKLFFLLFVGLIIQSFNYFGVNFIYIEVIGFIPFFILGIFLQKYQSVFRFLLNRSTILLIIGSVCLFFSVFFSFFFTNKNMGIVTTSIKPSVFIYSIGILSVMLKRFYKPIKILKMLDDNSMNIYYVHPIVLLVLNEIIDNDNNLFLLVIKFFIILVASLSISMAVTSAKKYLKCT